MNPATKLMVDALRALAAQGKTYQEAANEMGATYHSVATYARKYNIPLRQLVRGRKPAPPDERSEDLRDRYQAGETLEQLGQMYGVTRERVRQLLKKHYGITAVDGGKAAQVRKSRAEFFRARDERSQRRWGCSYEDYKKILKHPNHPTYAFCQQRKNADSRGIGWELTLWQWWKTWEQSGHWDDRGRGHAYAMCRLNDTGPYAVDNVYIATNVENIRDYYANRKVPPVQEVA